MSEIGIKQLAKKLGISTASVSRALSKPDRVSDSMRERVLLAAKESGYRPNKLGAGLRTSKTKNIIVIIPDISDSFNSGVIESIESAASEHGYSVLFGHTKGLREKELAFGEMVGSKQADGIICFSHRLPFEDEELNSKNFSLPPIVNCCEYINSPHASENKIPWISVDDVQAGRDATEHLIALGHTEIAVITGDMNTPSANFRLQGYRDALAAAGLPYKEQLVCEGDYTLEAGERFAKKIVSMKKRPTAIFCMCDETALGCIHDLKKHDFEVPKDISVVGFDDIKYAAYCSPPLTTVAQPVDEIGRTCVEVLIKLINDDEQEQQTFMLPHRLMVRGSTARV